MYTVTEYKEKNNCVTGVSYFVANPASQSVISLLQSLDKHNIYITK